MIFCFTIEIPFYQVSDPISDSDSEDLVADLWSALKSYAELKQLLERGADVRAATKADVWSIGVIAYILLAGYPPFYIHETSSQAEQGSNEEALLRKIVNADYQFHPDTWQEISPEAISFIR